MAIEKCINEFDVDDVIFEEGSTGRELFVVLDGKIDRSFVRDLPDDTEDRAIAQAIISMGRALGMTIVAEGVETPAQEAFLRAHGCDEMQGYLFSRPVPPEQLADLLRPAPLLVSPPLQPAASDAPAKPSARRSRSRKATSRAAL